MGCEEMQHALEKCLLSWIHETHGQNCSYTSETPIITETPAKAKKNKSQIVSLREGGVGS